MENFWLKMTVIEKKNSFEKIKNVFIFKKKNNLLSSRDVYERYL